MYQKSFLKLEGCYLFVQYHSVLFSLIISSDAVLCCYLSDTPVDALPFRITYSWTWTYSIGIYLHEFLAHLFLECCFVKYARIDQAEHAMGAFNCHYTFPGVSYRLLWQFRMLSKFNYLNIYSYMLLFFRQRFL